MAKFPDIYDYTVRWAAKKVGIPQNEILPTMGFLFGINQASGVAAQIIFWYAKLFLEGQKLAESKVFGMPNAVDLLTTSGTAAIFGDVVTIVAPIITLFAIKDHLNKGERIRDLNPLNNSVEGISMAYEQGYL